VGLTAVAPDLVGWTPVRVGWREQSPTVDWCHTEGVAFTDPFFTETVERCFRHPFRVLFRHETPIEEVGRFVAAHPGVPPAGFLFHMSRCGSTLVSQMLATVPEHLVLSEPPPVDSVLRAHQVRPDLSDEDRITWLRWMVAAMGQARGGARRLFVKFDAWSTAELSLVRRAFPDVPWLFLFRDPVEVLVSHARRPGAHMIPGVVADGEGASMADFGARVLAGICEAALDLRDDPLATFVEHTDLPGFVPDDLLDRWGLAVDDAGVARMRRAGGLSAKNPVLPFEDDRPWKQAAATPELRRAADRWLAPLYDRLKQAARDVTHVH
jgi:gluconate kinase